MKERKLIKRKKFDEVLIKYIEENKPEFIEMSMMIDMLERARGARYGYDEIRKRVYTHIMIDKISKRNKYYEFSYDNKKKIFTYEKKESYAKISSGSSEKLLEDDSNLKVEYKPLDQRVTTKTTTTTTTETTTTAIIEEVVPVSEEKGNNVEVEISYAGYININMFPSEEGKMINNLDEIIFPEMEKSSENNIIKTISSILSVKVEYYNVYYKVINVDTVSNIQWLYDTLFKGSKKCPFIVYGSKHNMLGIIKSLMNNGLNILSLDEFCDGVYSPVANKDDHTAFMLHARSKWICQAVNEYVKSLLSQRKEPKIDIHEIERVAKEEAKREIIASIVNL